MPTGRRRRKYSRLLRSLRGILERLERRLESDSEESSEWSATDADDLDDYVHPRNRSHGRRIHPARSAQRHHLRTTQGRTERFQADLGEPGGSATPGRGVAAPAQTCRGCWVPSSNGQVPARAFAGGEDKGEQVYVARAHSNGSLAPGKLLSSHGCAFVAWGGQEIRCREYEVLCDFRGEWKACSGENIPSNALIAGESEDGEPLYVGRVAHDGGRVLGKVQASHRVCYIPYGGEEKAFENYEILVQ